MSQSSSPLTSCPLLQAWLSSPPEKPQRDTQLQPEASLARVLGLRSNLNDCGRCGVTICILNSGINLAYKEGTADH